MTEHSPRKENFFLNLALNIIIPTIILSKFSGEAHLGVKGGLIVALAFPIIYGIMDFFRARKINVFSALGVVSILLTGGISLLELDPKYIAIKEATIPAILGLATLISLKTRYPLVKTLLFNEKIMRIETIHQALEQAGNKLKFDRVLINASYMIAASFVLSSILNYALAKILLVSAPGTEAFNAELGKMTAYSYVVIAIPSMSVLAAALFYLFRSVTKLTGLPLEEVFVDQTAGK